MSTTKSLASFIGFPPMLKITDLRLLRCGRTATYAATRAPGFPDAVIVGGSYLRVRDEVTAWLLDQRVTTRIRSTARSAKTTAQPGDVAYAHGQLPQPTPAPKQKTARND